MAASAGGIDAFRCVLSMLPADFPAPLLLVQHLSPAFPSHLPEILSRHTRLPTLAAREGVRPQPGCVYVATPDRHLVVRPDGRLHLSGAEPVWFARPSADRLFESVALSCGERAIAVVLTGRGYDGARGLRAVRQRGGVTIAQSRATCHAPEMPVAAIEAGGAELVLPLAKIAPVLQALTAESVEAEGLPASPASLDLAARF